MGIEMGDRRCEWWGTGINLSNPRLTKSSAAKNVDTSREIRMSQNLKPPGTTVCCWLLSSGFDDGSVVVGWASNVGEILDAPELGTKS